MSRRPAKLRLVARFRRAMNIGLERFLRVFGRYGRTLHPVADPTCAWLKMEGFEEQGDRLAALTVDGQRESIDLPVLGIGAAPECRLAAEAGLACDNSAA